MTNDGAEPIATKSLDSGAPPTDSPKVLDNNMLVITRLSQLLRNGKDRMCCEVSY